MTKYIFVTGGVLSGLGKGVVTASIAKLLQMRGYSVDVIKIDPYLNVDPGTLNPIEHGEVFVCEHSWHFKPAEGYSFTIAEVDQDFGTYERFLNKNIEPYNNITSGQIYLTVILKERVGKYLGKTIQVIPHITDEIKNRIRIVAKKSKPDVLLIEIGGTVGDIEAMPFLEAVRQFRLEEGPGNTLLVHITLVPYLETVGQLKSKPTQHSVKILQSTGLQPDIIVCRAPFELTEDIKRKISLFCSVPYEAVISDPDMETVYEIPILFEKQGLGEYICRLLGLGTNRLIQDEYLKWNKIVNMFKQPTDYVEIAMPGKYTFITDSYISINEALRHAAAWNGVKIKIRWIETEIFEEDIGKLEEELSKVDGILLTPGFGRRGVEGMISVAEYALNSPIPFLGICFGAQLLFVAFYRSIMGYKTANTTEVDPNTPYPVVDLLPEQKSIKMKGGTMRLAAHKVYIKKNTKLYDAYKKEVVLERFRHRYHIIKEYAQKAKEYGLIVSATDATGNIINAIEVDGEGWTIGVQFHPEFKSRPESPSPIYLTFIKEIIKYKKLREKSILKIKP